MAAISAKDVKALRDRTGAGMMDCKRALGDAGGDVSKAVELLRERGLAKAGKREGRATSEGVVAVSLDGNRGGMVEVGCETDFVARNEQFVTLAEELAGKVAEGAGLTSPDALLDASTDGEKVRDRISAAIGKIGENIVVKRVSRIEVADGLVGGYVHVGGKVGVIVGLSGVERDEGGTLAKDVAMHVAAADPTPVAIDREGVDGNLLESERGIYRNQALQEGKPEKVIDRIVEGKLNKFLSDVCLVEQAFVKDADRTVGALLGEAKIAAFERFKLGETSGE